VWAWRWRGGRRRRRAPRRRTNGAALACDDRAAGARRRRSQTALEEMDTKLTGTQNSIFKGNESMDKFKLQMNWNQEELEQWALAAKQKEDDNLALQASRVARSLAFVRSFARSLYWFVCFVGRLPRGWRHGSSRLGRADSRCNNPRWWCAPRRGGGARW